MKVIVVEVVKLSADKAVALALPRLAEAFEKAAWKRRGLKEGWVRVTKETLESGILEPSAPTSTERSLLLLHGTFSDAAAAFRPLAHSTFFDRVASTYGDRVFAFNHFSVSRTPEENARMLLAGLPDGYNDIRRRDAFTGRAGPAHAGGTRRSAGDTRTPFQTGSSRARRISE